MEKLLFLLPDVDAARDVVATLRDMNVSDDRIGVIANEEARVEDLPEPDVEDDSDVLPAFARGIAAGGATGLLAGLAALALPPLGLVAGGAALVATTTLGGASFGAFASALVGTSVDNSQLREYEDAIGRGEILMIVDIDDDDAEQAQVTERLVERHPELKIEGTKGAPPIV